MSEVETPPQYVAVPFFDFPDRPKPREKTKAQIPSWRGWSGARRQCDPCVTEVFAADRAGDVPPIPRHARHIRSVAATGEQVHMCDTHAAPIKAVDEAVKAAAKARAKESRRRPR